MSLNTRYKFIGVGASSRVLPIVTPKGHHSTAVNRFVPVTIQRIIIVDRTRRVITLFFLWTYKVSCLDSHSEGTNYEITVLNFVTSIILLYFVLST